MNNKKKIILSVLVALLLLAIGVTYAFFTYENGTKSDIVTGQIYMNYEETSTISLTGVFPETKAQALSRQDENGVFEFSITRLLFQSLYVLPLINTSPSRSKYILTCSGNIFVDCSVLPAINPPSSKSIS